MRKLLFAALAVAMLGVASYAIAGVSFQKLPKCSGKLCRDIGCPADVLCVQGAHVVTCADWCGGN